VWRDAEDTKRARSIVRDAGVALQIGTGAVFVPELQTIRDGIADGAFGDVLTLSCLQWDGEPPSAAFRSRSGGVFIDMGVHEFDQARWMTGSDFTTLSAVASSAISDPEVIDDPDSAQVLAENPVGCDQCSSPSDVTSVAVTWQALRCSDRRITFTRHS